ncbi:AAA family ATPase [Methylobacterium oryzae]|uniref:AAA family ATPase n=1 Tax=Methylobacterium oryzae TaxID=334852 RepID=UPI002F2D5BCB
MRLESWTKIHPEYAGNPFIKQLPGPQPISADSKMLQMNVRFDDSERCHEPHHRRIFARRILDYMHPIRNQTLVPEFLRVAIYEGYKDKNPRNKSYKAKIIQSAAQLDEVRKGKKGYQDFPTPLKTKGVPGFSILGCPGMGKSLTIDRTISGYPDAIVHRFSPTGAIYTQIPILKVECPSTGSRKSLCIDILNELGLRLGVDLLKLAGKGASGDVYMMYVQHQALLCGLGVLIIDEIQNINKASEGPETVMNFLVTLANRLQLPIVLIGTSSAEVVLQYDFRIARRAAGSGSYRWNNLKFDAEFRNFVQGMWKYQWLTSVTPLNEDLMSVLYDESQGVIDVVVKLFYLVQMSLIHNSELVGGSEIITASAIRAVAKKYLYLIEPMIKALRSNNPFALDKFPDLKPLHRLVADFAARSSLDSVGGSTDLSVVMDTHLASETIVTSDSSADDALRALMAGYGVPESDRLKLLKEVDKLSPDGDLRTRSETLGRLLNCRSRSRMRPATLKPNYVAGDLRLLVSEGKKRNLTGYEALREAGVVRDCLHVVGGLA